VRRPATAVVVPLIALVVTACTGGTAVPAGTEPAASIAPTAAPTIDPSSSTPSVAPSASPEALPTLAATTQTAGEPPAGSIQIEMTADALAPRFVPDTITAPSGTVVFFLTSLPVSGTFGPHHDMVIGPDIGTPLTKSDSVQPATSATFTVEAVPPGSYRFWCSVDTGHGRHHTLGMVGTLIVTP
jgi:plastocyanin